MNKPFAAFDIDGTLIRWQLFHAIVKKLTDYKTLSPSEYNQMEELFDKWKSRSAPDAFHQYENALLATWSAILQHVPYSAYVEAVDESFNEHKDYVYRYTRDLIANLKQQGYFLIAISGSQQEAIDKVAEYYDFDVAIGSQWAVKGDIFTGERFSPVDDKGTTLCDLASEHKLSFEGSWAVGDSASDSKMMELAENPVAFNPDQSLLKIATEQGWPIVVERKNVIYRLEDQGGNYKLI